ncbi:MAG TPA: 4Fe-4S binding protein [bacterium]|jgi:2-oxoglutarate ferredoxin oxidoreductase subunit delta|nr:4Fe-4S binding protein [bacterium]HNT65048.1 4Fe-4S binding protein [bacterium]HOX84455.1 4Fe-4S binding protein [bacterium]HPG45948.1 4Fe-4S binding protein [bacterium]HPM97770.1 4Fe-4S binding protein [bacterium]
MGSDVISEEKIVIRINPSWCKGCAICVEFCPQDVLVMESGIAKVANLAACTACGLCELRCPDFAITVEKR